MKNFNALHILFFCSSLFLLSCNGKTDNESKYLSKTQELKILLSDPVETLDPLKIVYSSDWEVANNIFEGLVSINFSGQIQNVVIESITIKPDNLTYEFKLKDNVFFHDSPCFQYGKGRKLNSSDIYYTFERLAKWDYKFSNWHLIRDKIVGIEDFSSNLNDRISGIQIYDSLRFNIILKHPFSAFLKILANPNFYIVPKEAIDYFGENFDENPVGTGPFRISEYKKYENIFLVKNENYHFFDNNGDRLPYLNSIEYRTIDKTENRISELVKKSINLISVSEDEFLNFKKNKFLLDDLNVKKGKLGLGIRYWTFYFEDEDNEKFQKLRELISTEFYNSFYDKRKNLRTQTLAPLNFLSPHKTNLDIHRQALNRISNTNFIYSDTLVIMANMEYSELLELEKIFKKLNLPYKRVIKPDNYYGEISKVKPTLFRVSMRPSFPDAIEYYSLFYSGNIKGINLGNFSNSDYDKIYEELLIENNIEAQQRLYNKLEKILIDEAAAIYLSHFEPTYFLYSKNIKQLSFNFMMPDYTNTYFE